MRRDKERRLIDSIFKAVRRDLSPTFMTATKPSEWEVSSFSIGGSPYRIHIELRPRNEDTNPWRQ